MSDLEQLWAMLDRASVDYESTVTGAGTDGARTLVTVRSEDATLAASFVFDRDDKLERVSSPFVGRTGG